MVPEVMYEAVIGLEVHAELSTRSKMFCSCPVVDPTLTAPNLAVCPVCAGMPGVLPVVNRMAVEHAIESKITVKTGQSPILCICPKFIYSKSDCF